MLMLATLRRSGGIEALARNLEVPPPAAAQAASALMPLVQGAYRRHCGTPDGGLDIRPMLELLERLGGGKLAVAVMAPDPIEPQTGWELAEQVFGSRERILAVAEAVALSSGCEERLLVAALPVLTMLVGGYLAARAQGAGLQGAGLQSSGLQSAGWNAEKLVPEFDALLEIGQEPNPLDAILPPPEQPG